MDAHSCGCYRWALLYIVFYIIVLYIFLFFSYNSVIILDLFQGKATGDLYIDDYHTHEYRSGQFALRKFTFENNQLINR